MLSPAGQLPAFDSLKYTEARKHVLSLVEKAATSLDSNEAMRYAQAALNAANALCSLDTLPTKYRVQP